MDFGLAAAEAMNLLPLWPPYAEDETLSRFSILILCNIVRTSAAAGRARYCTAIVA